MFSEDFCFAIGDEMSRREGRETIFYYSRRIIRICAKISTVFTFHFFSIFFPFPSGVPEFVEFPEGNREGWGRGGVACFLIMFPFEGDSFRSGDYTEVERGLGVVERFFICGRSHEEAKMWNSIIGILVTIFRKLFFVFFPIEIKKKEKMEKTNILALFAYNAAAK